MLTKITINNFKKLEKISFSLAQSVVIIGPNNAGKSTIFQALCLWEVGVTSYLQSVLKKDLNKTKRVTLNRKDLLNTPIEDARFLWKDKKVTYKDKSNSTQPLKLEIELEGENSGIHWKSKTEFLFYNNESFSCGIVSGLAELKKIYENGERIHFGFLQPMSGISANEDKLTQGSIDRKLGEGRTAEVLRNICYDLVNPEKAFPLKQNIEEKWTRLVNAIKYMFGVKLLKPEFIKVSGFIELQYEDNGIRYDISSGGRGFQQMLLLISYMLVNPETILLLDEPDAHLEVVRQREAFQLINQIAEETNSQLLIASHSEIVLDEAAEASKVVALIENRVIELNIAATAQSTKYIRKALTEIGWEKYYLARLKGHIVYLEGSTDLQMLICFANKLKHPVESLLKKANVQYTSDNVPSTAIANFVALKEIFEELKGLALFDNLPTLQANPKLDIICWQKRELENYFAKPIILLKYAKLLNAKHTAFSTTFLEETMQKVINDYTIPAVLKDLSNEWWNKTKLSDDWLDNIFTEFYKHLNVPKNFYKRDYYQLISLLTPAEIDIEITQKLDTIYKLIK